MSDFQEGVWAAAREARAQARRVRERAPECAGAWMRARVLEEFADSLAEANLCPEPTGLEYRGG